MIYAKKIKGKEVIFLQDRGENFSCADCPVLYGGECYTTEDNNLTEASKLLEGEKE